MSFDGKGQRIQDGDTLTVRGDGLEFVIVRLSAIDAPERGQAFGNVAKKELTAKCLNRSIQVVSVGKDGRGRTVGDVSCDGIQMQEYMVRNGFAWVSDKYAQNYPQLYSLQQEAMQRQIGLWADENPMRPDIFRKRK